MMRELTDCGKRWEGWRFADQFDPSQGVGYHSCLWDCKEGFHEAFQLKKKISYMYTYLLQAEINLEISLVDRKSSV